MGSIVESSSQEGTHCYQCVASGRLQWKLFWKEYQVEEYGKDWMGGNQDEMLFDSRVKINQVLGFNLEGSFHLKISQNEKWVIMNGKQEMEEDTEGNPIKDLEGKKTQSFQIWFDCFYGTRFFET